MVVYKPNNALLKRFKVQFAVKESRVFLFQKVFYQIAVMEADGVRELAVLQISSMDEIA